MYLLKNVSLYIYNNLFLVANIVKFSNFKIRTKKIVTKFSSTLQHTQHLPQSFPIHLFLSYTLPELPPPQTLYTLAHACVCVIRGFTTENTRSIISYYCTRFFLPPSLSVVVVVVPPIFRMTHYLDSAMRATDYLLK